MRLLLVEDNKSLAEWLCRNLRREQYTVNWLDNGADADIALQSESYELVILDLALPKMQGSDVLKRLRARKDTTPVLILTADNTLTSRVNELDNGADDYVAKPFEVEELEARIRVLLRRPARMVETGIVCGRLNYDTNTREFAIDGKTLPLTPRERAVLEVLAMKIGTTVSKPAIARSLFSFDDGASVDSIEIYVHRLRKKIEGSGAASATCCAMSPMAYSLRGRLLARVMLPLTGVVIVGGGISYHNASLTALVTQDRLLLGSARIVAEQLHFEDGSLEAPIPPAALELFDSGDIDRIYYRVTAVSGQIVTGYAELEMPDVKLQAETPFFFDTEVRGAQVRAVAFAQPVLIDSGVQSTVVEIAQTVNGRQQLTNSLWMHATLKELVLLALAGGLTLFGLNRGLQPLIELRTAVLTHQPGSPLALNADAVPAELVSLVVAFNDHARRLDQHTRAQRIFIQNAAHQLRTPLTVLTTQVSFASRSDDATARRESLAAVRETVQQAVRLVNQLLTLSVAESQDTGALRTTSIRLDDMVRQVLEALAGQAHAKDIDLGFEMVAEEAWVQAHALALREITMNLLDNALRYTQRGGVVTCRIDVGPSHVVLTVEDNGPGIPPEHRERVFERFYRVHDDDSSGCGLGLPIVREFASRMNASVTLETPTGPCGLAVKVAFRRSERDGDAIGAPRLRPHPSA